MSHDQEIKDKIAKMQAEEATRNQFETEEVRRKRAALAKGLRDEDEDRESEEE